MRLFVPVREGYWTQKELKDGTYSYLDLLDILEMIAIDVENQSRDAEARKREVRN